MSPVDLTGMKKLSAPLEGELQEHLRALKEIKVTFKRSIQENRGEGHLA